jgi:hypothetical protein
MLPFDRKPWAKTVAGTVIVLSFLGAIVLAFYFYSQDMLHISEMVGIFLLLLTIVPPNAAIVLRKPDALEPQPFGHTRRNAH